MKKPFEVLMVLAICFLFSCQGSGENNRTDETNTHYLPKDSSTNDKKDTTTVGYKILPFDVEIAETLVAKYYSEQNQQAKYPYYKGLLVKIDQIKNIPGTDTMKVSATVNGRKWLRPNQDTITTAFREIKEFKAFPSKQIWWSDILPPPNQ